MNSAASFPLFLGVLSLISIGCSSGADINIDWVIKPYPDRTATVGDKVTFTWSGNDHNVFWHPTNNCDGTGAEQIAATSGDGTGSYKFDKAGRFSFVCEETGHCPAGQIIKFEVAEVSIADTTPTATPPAPPTPPPPTPPAPADTPKDESSASYASTAAIGGVAAATAVLVAML